MSLEAWEQLAARQDEERAKLLLDKNNAYVERNRLVAALGEIAKGLGWPVGTAQHVGDWEDDWRTILLIDLPSGQVSWHFHDSEAFLLQGFAPHPKAWDGHTTAKKYQRLALLTGELLRHALREATP